MTPYYPGYYPGGQAAYQPPTVGQVAYQQPDGSQAAYQPPNAHSFSVVYPVGTAGSSQRLQQEQVPSASMVGKSVTNNPSLGEEEPTTAAAKGSPSLESVGSVVGIIERKAGEAVSPSSQVQPIPLMSTVSQKLPVPGEIEHSDVEETPRSPAMLLGTGVDRVASPENITSVIPPVANGQLLSTSDLKDAAAKLGGHSDYDTSKRTCSLNLVCFRSGAKGPCLKQLHTTAVSKWDADGTGAGSPVDFGAFVSKHPQYVTRDEALFREMRRVYEQEMCTFFRRCFSLKTLRTFQILEVSCEDATRTGVFARLEC